MTVRTCGTVTEEAVGSARWLDPQDMLGRGRAEEVEHWKVSRWTYSSWRRFIHGTDKLFEPYNSDSEDIQIAMTEAILT